MSTVMFSFKNLGNVFTLIAAAIVAPSVTVTVFVPAAAIEVVSPKKTRPHPPNAPVTGLVVRAVSKKGVVPQAYVSRDEASAACEAATLLSRYEPERCTAALDDEQKFPACTARPCEGLMARVCGGTTPTEALERVMNECVALLQSQEACWDTLRASLASAGIHVMDFTALGPGQRDVLRAYFKREVFPVLTPLAVDPGHPFPHISHRSLSLMVALDDPEVGPRFARVKVPNNLPRLIQVPIDGNHAPLAAPGLGSIAKLKDRPLLDWGVLVLSG